jgi:hypothetical protein
MKQISTPAEVQTENNTAENIDRQSESSGGPAALSFPSERSVRNILAYSKSLEVMDSMLLGKFGYIKN